MNPPLNKSSLEAAAEAAAKVNAMLIAKGKLKLPAVTTKPKVVGTSKSSGDLYTAEVEINDAPISARNMLTRGHTQDEINKYSGAAVSTRGRYMSFEDRAKNNMGERPLYLHVQASSNEALDLAVQRIQEIIQQHVRNASASGIKINKFSPVSATTGLNFTPPPLMSINTSSVTSALPFVQDKVFVGLEHAPATFPVQEKVMGPGGSYLQHIRSETGANVTLRGKGSGYIEPVSGREAFEPLHIHLTHPKTEGLQAAKELAVNLIHTVLQEFAQWQQQQTLTALTFQPPTAITVQPGLNVGTSGIPSLLSTSVAMPITSLSTAIPGLLNQSTGLVTMSPAVVSSSGVITQPTFTNTAVISHPNLSSTGIFNQPVFSSGIMTQPTYTNSTAVAHPILTDNVTHLTGINQQIIQPASVSLIPASSQSIMQTPASVITSQSQPMVASIITSASQQQQVLHQQQQAMALMSQFQQSPQSLPSNLVAAQPQTAFSVQSSQPQPGYTVQSSQPGFTVQSSQPGFTVQSSQPAFTVQSSQPGFTVQSSQSQPGFTVQSSQAQPGFTVQSSQAQPGFTVQSSQAQPGFTVQSSQAQPGFTVQSSQAQPGFTVQSSQAQPGFTVQSSQAQQGFTVQSSQPQPAFTVQSSQHQPGFTVQAPQPQPAFAVPTPQSQAGFPVQAQQPQTAFAIQTPQPPTGFPVQAQQPQPGYTVQSSQSQAGYPNPPPHPHSHSSVLINPQSGLQQPQQTSLISHTTQPSQPGLISQAQQPLLSHIQPQPLLAQAPPSSAANLLSSQTSLLPQQSQITLINTQLPNVQQTGQVLVSSQAQQQAPNSNLLASQGQLQAGAGGALMTSQLGTTYLTNPAILQASNVGISQPLSPYSYQLASNSNVGTSTATTTTNTVASYSPYRLYAEQPLKRRFTEEPHKEDESKDSILGYRHISSNQNTVNLNSNNGSVPQYLPPQGGLQENLPPNLLMPPPPPPPVSPGSSQNDRDKQLMPPPPSPSQSFVTGDQLRNGEPERKRLKGALVSVAAYGSSDEEEDDNGSLSPSSMRQTQRMVAKYKTFTHYTGKPQIYGPVDNNQQYSTIHFASVKSSYSVSHYSHQETSYQQRSNMPFWMAPN